MMWTFVSIAIGLLGVLCASVARRFPDQPSSAAVWALALVSLPAGLAIGLRPNLSAAALAAFMVVIAGFYWGLSYATHAFLAGRWRIVLAVVGGLLPLLGAFFARDAAAPLALCLLAATLINGELALRFAQAWFALAALFAILLVPAFVGQGVAFPALSVAEQAWAYVALAAFLLLWRQQLRGLGESFAAVGITGYLLAVLTALAYALVAGPSTTLAVGAVLAFGLYLIGAREPLPEAFTYISIAIGAYSLIQLTDVYSWPVSLNALILATFGSLLYLAGIRTEAPHRAAPLRYAGLMLAFLGLYPGLLTAIPPLSPVIALADAGLLLWFEARHQNSAPLEELSGGVMVLAFDWLLRHEHIMQLQWYTLPAAAYFAYLAYRRRELGAEAYILLVAGSLAFLTVPLAVQVFLLGTPGYFLILEAVGLVFIGSATGYRLITRWALITLAAGVLYQLPYLLSLLTEFLNSLRQS